MSYNQFSASTTYESQEEYGWPSHGGLALQDIQAISNLAGITYSYDSGSVTSSERAEVADCVDHSQLYWYDVQHPQMVSLHYGDTCETHFEERRLQGPSHASDDDYYYANGLLSTHRFSESTHMIQPKPLCPPMMASFVSDVQDDPVTSTFDSQEPFPTSLTPLPFPPATIDDPAGNIDAYPKLNHDFILPNQHSTYSELSANLIYMATQATGLDGEVLVVPSERGTKRRKREKVMTRVKPVDKQLKRVHEGIPHSPGSLPRRSKTERKGNRRRGPESIEEGQTSLPLFERFQEEENGQAGQDQSTKHIPPPSSVRGASTLSANRPSTKKKLGLACLFCRERKIACGRPSESNPDQTCNQCARRSFKCEYPIESRRGQHKRPKSKPGVA